MMGVINITPNSFSDGGEFNHVESFKKQIQYLKSYGLKIFDLGAESTAPFNEAISNQVELERLVPFLELIKSGDIFSSSDTLSFDTYKIETMRFILESLKGSSFKGDIIWNDVSGVIDSALFDLMDEYSFTYVYSHNLVPSRDETSHHMNYVSEKIDLVSYFSEAHAIFSQAGVMNRVIFDPCFGFAKSKEQNYQLLTSIDKWCSDKYRWLIGISRKSFLQALSQEEEKSQRIMHSELIHSHLLRQWMDEFPNYDITIRLHDPRVFQTAVRGYLS